MRTTLPCDASWDRLAAARGGEHRVPGYYVMTPRSVLPRYGWTLRGRLLLRRWLAGLL